MNYPFSASLHGTKDRLVDFYIDKAIVEGKIDERHGHKELLKLLFMSTGFLPGAIQNEEFFANFYLLLYMNLKENMRFKNFYFQLEFAS